MRDSETAAAFAAAHARRLGRIEIGPDELLLGALQEISRFGVVRLGALMIDLEELGLDWLKGLEQSGSKVLRLAPKLVYSQGAVRIFDLAAVIAKADGGSAIGVDHLLAAFAKEDSGLMGKLKQKYGITDPGWRAAIAERAALASAPASANEAAPAELRVEPGSVAGRDYLTPEEAAEALGLHVQTLRGYVRSGKLPALRLAGERAIRIRRADLETVLEPLVPQSMALNQS
jgi:excisionase family DNA binding protein